MAKTKKQREAEGKDALRKRILDIAAGAFGGELGPEEGIEIQDVTAEPVALCRFIGAIEGVFGQQISKDGEQSILSLYWNIEEYADLESTVDFLWRHGVRA